MQWAQTLGQNDPDKVVLLYATDGVLWGTLSPTVRADRAALRDYFVTAFKVLPGLKVTFGEQLIRVYGSTAVNTGYYTFSYSKDGEPKTLPARYSFTFVKEGENWMIVDHHHPRCRPRLARYSLTLHAGNRRSISRGARQGRNRLARYVQGGVRRPALHRRADLRRARYSLRRAPPRRSRTTLTLGARPRGVADGSPALAAMDEADLENYRTLLAGSD
jgi:hypothetical protein